MTPKFLFTLIFFFAAAPSLVAQTTATDYFNFGNSKSSAKEYDAAIIAFTKALELKYTSPGNVYLLRAIARSAKDDLDGAWADATAALPLVSSKELAHSVRGEVAYKKKDFDAAIAEYTKAIEIDPKFSQAYANRGAALRGKGDLPGAVANFSKMIERGVGSHDAYVYRGNTYLVKGDRQLAMADYDKAVAMAPDYVSVYIARGYAHYSYKNYDLAIADLNKALSMNAQHPDAHHWRGHALHGKGDAPGAIEAFTKALELKPDAHYYSDRANSYRDLEKFPESIADLSKAIGLAPESNSYYRPRAWTYLFSGDPARAYADVETTLKLGGVKDNGPYAVLAGYLALRESGKTKEAAAFLTKWIIQSDKSLWGTKLLQHLAGSLTSTELLVAAGTDPAKLTEARTLLGETARFSKKLDVARSHFEWVRDNGVRSSFQYALALYELKKL